MLTERRGMPLTRVSPRASDSRNSRVSVSFISCSARRACAGVTRNLSSAAGTGAPPIFANVFRTPCMCVIIAAIVRP
jgi:hypothetical protein